VRPNGFAFLTWDTEQKGLALRTQPTGNSYYKVIYSFHNRVRWYTLANAAAISLRQARQLARNIMFKVAQERDPQAEKLRRKQQRRQTP
jgi:hypothetical protein